MKNTVKLSALGALAVLLPGLGQAATMTPLPVTGWTQDMIINNGSPSYNLSITGTIDSGGSSIEGGTFAAADTYPVQPSGAATAINGLTNAIYTSASGSGTTFQFQDFSANNSLLLTGGLSGTLTLVTPATMTSLALIGTSGNGPTSASVVVNFADSSSSTYPITSGTGITADWFNYGGLTSVALPIGHRESNHNEDGYLTIFTENNAVISIYESDIALAAADQTKKVTSVTIMNTGSNGDIAVMAISSDAATSAPTALKITSSVFNFTNNTVALTFNSASGTTYHVTHSATLSGTDWATITGSTTPASAASTTITVPFTKGTKDFFRIETGS